jgi:hypothetical protein
MRVITHSRKVRLVASLKAHARRQAMRCEFSCSLMGCALVGVTSHRRVEPGPKSSQMRHRQGTRLDTSLFGARHRSMAVHLRDCCGGSPGYPPECSKLLVNTDVLAARCFREPLSLRETPALSDHTLKETRQQVPNRPSGRPQRSNVVTFGQRAGNSIIATASSTNVRCCLSHMPSKVGLLTSARHSNAEHTASVAAPQRAACRTGFQQIRSGRTTSESVVCGEHGPYPQGILPPPMAQVPKTLPQVPQAWRGRLNSLLPPTRCAASPVPAHVTGAATDVQFSIAVILHRCWHSMHGAPCIQPFS